jgi:hypothetical protein
MRLSRRLRDEAPFDPTAERVARFVSAQVGSPTPTEEGEREFLRRLAGFRQVRRNLKWFTLGLAMASALVVVGLAGLRFGAQEPAAVTLSYRVDNQVPPSGGYILVPQAAESLVAFSDGSKVRMEARTRGRVLEVNQRGAKFALEAGRVSVDIVPRARAQWSIEAGPFRVNVHGTSFTVAWNPLDAVFDVHLSSGAISVASPIAGPEIQMRAGQSLRVSLRDQTVSMEPTSRREVPLSTDTAASTSFEPSQPAPPGLAEAARWSHRGWMAALSDNKAADIVADAEHRGLTTVLERADSEDLWALANAARYAGRYPLASQALIWQRKRFPMSDRAREAAFLLGRLHDGDPDGPGKAIGWYNRYLLEARAGVDVSDALGRKMTLLRRWNRSADALAVARDYLRRFPRGTYANAARALVRSSTAGQ